MSASSTVAANTGNAMVDHFIRTLDALVDLEMALAAFPHRANLHHRLAAVYEKLGDREQMARHQTRAKALSTTSQKDPHPRHGVD